MRLLAPFLRVLAGLYRRTLLRRTCVIVVIGSFGKTTTTRALSLGLTGSISRWAGNNAGSWPALFLLMTRPSTRTLVIEVGIDAVGKMAPPARALRPDIVVVTSIGSEHNSSFGTLEATRLEKSRMVQAIRAGGTVILNGDDDNVLWMRSTTSAHCITFGRSAGLDVRATDIGMDWPRAASFTVEIENQRFPVETQLFGKPGIPALLAVFAVAHARGLAIGPLARRLERLEPFRSRLQKIALTDNRWLIRDEEKSAVETIEVALDLLARIPAPRKICVLGDITEPMGPTGDLFRSVGARIAASADIAILVGNSKPTARYRVGAVAAGMSSDSIHLTGTRIENAISMLDELSQPGDVILVKGRKIQRMARLSLHLMGRDVRCGVRRCQLKAASCDFCARLEVGWPGDPESVP